MNNSENIIYLNTLHKPHRVGKPVFSQFPNALGNCRNCHHNSKRYQLGIWHFVTKVPSVTNRINQNSNLHMCQLHVWYSRDSEIGVTANQRSRLCVWIRTCSPIQNAMGRVFVCAVMVERTSCERRHTCRFACFHWMSKIYDFETLTKIIRF